uniref:DENN domain-containing protein 3 n=1 Tax=Oncorhynchus mykiss TaxID=8022 RepID=A0A8K9UU82_ONCMY
EEGPVLMADHLPSGLLEACVVVGASGDKLKDVYQVMAISKYLLILDPEVLQVHVPPFVTKENADESGVPRTFSRVQCRRSFIKKKERLVVAPSGPGGAGSSEGATVTEDVSVPKDIDLMALPQLCFPGGLQVTNEPKEERFHFLVFTDVFGNQTHGVVVQCCRPFQVGVFPFYSPAETCDPFHYKAVKGQCSIRMDTGRPPGPLSSTLLLPSVFNLRPLMIVLPSREDKEHPAVDLDLHLPFLCFRSKQILQIITGILMEQRLVFFSADWARLTLVAECFMFYIHPLHWQHPYVPILSAQMLDFVMAPTAFLMGCHLNHFEEVAAETDDLILINIDDGTVSSSCSETVDLPDVPFVSAECFTKRKGLQLQHDLEVCHQGAGTDVNEMRMLRRQWQQNLNWEIQKVTLELIVNMFRDVSGHLNYEHRVFNSEEFLKTRELADLPFYRKVLETHIFHSFLKDRLNRKMDAFTRMEVNTRSETQKMKAMTDNPRRPTMQEMARKYSSDPEIRLNKRLGMSLPNLGEERHLNLVRQTSLKKTIIPESGEYTLRKCGPKRCVQSVTIRTTYILHKSFISPTTLHTTLSLFPRYFYLRGFMNTLCSKRLDALSDFQNLYKTDIEIFPTDLVKALVDSLQKDEFSQVDRRPELKRLIFKVKTDNERVLVQDDDHVKKFQLPKTHMLQEDFVKRIQESGIVKDVATIHRLFEALTVGQQKQIDPEVFRVFYTFWKETEVEAQDVHLPAEVMEHLDNNECVYKLSCSVKTNQGVGKIAMTQKRLFLLTDGRPGFIEITKFRDIKEVNISFAPFLLLRIPSLKIKCSLRKEVFEANLKSACDLWNLMVREMWAGRTMADDHKDPQYMQQALTNVLLMDAVVGCLQTQKAIFAASKLAYFDRVKHEVPVMVPKTTLETLKHKINPSLDLPAPQTVHVLLYTPGQLSYSEADGDGNPKLWCALSGGRVVVFDAASWSMQQNCVQVGSSQLNCMLGLDQDQVWIGSQDSIIYIIDSRSMSCNKQLTEHRHEVMDFTYSCSADGTVILWDLSTLKVKKQFQLTCDRLMSIQLFNGTLWCCKDGIVELRKNGTPHRKMTLPEDLRSIPTEFSSLILFLERGQLWTSCSDSDELCLWHCKDLTKPFLRVRLQNCTGVNCMIKVKNQIWVGCSGPSPDQCRMSGKIYIVDTESHSVEKELMAHTDSVQALCSAEGRYVLSGSACQDGKIAIWKVE